MHEFGIIPVHRPDRTGQHRHKRGHRKPLPSALLVAHAERHRIPTHQQRYCCTPTDLTQMRRRKRTHDHEEGTTNTHNRSPKSPRPGTIKSRSSRQSSMAPVTTVTSGNSPLTAARPCPQDTGKQQKQDAEESR